MRLDATILTVIRFYPNISQTREVVLNHLFFVIGNGYEWKNGELVCWDEDEWEGVDPVQHAVEWVRNFTDEQGMDDAAFYVEHYLSRVLPIIETAQERATTPWYPHKFEHPYEDIELPMNWSFIYPISSAYSRVNTVPDDVKDDWLCGAVEALNMVFRLSAVPFDIMEDFSGWDPEESESLQARNLTKALQSKASLIERFGDRLERMGVEWLSYLS